MMAIASSLAPSGSAFGVQKMHSSRAPFSPTSGTATRGHCKRTCAVAQALNCKRIPVTHKELRIPGSRNSRVLDSLKNERSPFAPSGWRATLAGPFGQVGGLNSVLRGRSLRTKVLAGAASVTVLAAGVIGYKITHKGPPSFRRGGQFAVAGPPGSTTTSGLPSPETTVTTAAPPIGVPGSTASSSTTSTTTSTGTACYSPVTTQSTSIIIIARTVS